MLILTEIRKTYECLTGKLSEINRQLCFVGFGIIWIFNKTAVQGISIPEELYLPSFLLCLSLLFDIIQYIYSSCAWYIFYLKNRKKDTNDDKIEVDENECINIPTWILFLVKVALLILAYVFIGYFLFTKL